MGADLLAFLPPAIVLVLVPGADTAICVKNTVLGGTRGGLLTSAGASTGHVLWGAAAGVGLAALVATSAAAFAALKLAGAAYLVLLGLQALWASRGTRGSAGPGPEPFALPGRSGAASYRQGLLGNVLNPKAAVWTVAFLPQFVSAQHPILPQFLLLSAISATLSFVVLGAYVAGVSRARRVAASAAFRRWMDRVFGSVLVALGLRLALERR